MLAGVLSARKEEASELEAVEQGQVNQWSEVREIYQVPRSAIWEQEVLPRGGGVLCPDCARTPNKTSQPKNNRPQR
jgi:hypothetical protein